MYCTQETQIQSLALQLGLQLELQLGLVSPECVPKANKMIFKLIEENSEHTLFSIYLENDYLFQVLSDTG